ncbi:15245_t:CDS:2, partial [Dentiscutata heterogama]
MASFSDPSSDLEMNEPNSSISEAEAEASASACPNPINNRKKRKNNGLVCGYGHRCISNRDVSENSNQIEFLPPVNTKNLIQKVRAAIYLSLDRLWELPNESSLIAMILDPRMKNFPFINGSECLVNENLEEPILTTDLADDAEDGSEKEAILHTTVQ